MKKLFLLLMTLLCSLGLASCAGENLALSKVTDILFLRRHPIAPFTAEESGRMQSFMSANRALVTDDAVYTLELDAQHEPVLGRYSLKDGKISDFRVLMINCVPKWLAEHEGALYYINELNESRIERLEADSGRLEVLSDYPCSYLQIKDGRLYFCDAEGFFCTTAMDGGDKRIIIDKPCCYPYILGEALIFQSESEGEILKLRFSIDGKPREIALTESRAYAPLVIEGRLYYTMGGRIHSMGLDGLDPETLDSPQLDGAAEFIREGEIWYARGITQDYGVKQWRCPIEGGVVEENGYMGYLYCDFTDGKRRIDADYFSDGRLRAFLLTGTGGGRNEYLYGEVTNTR